MRLHRIEPRDDWRERIAASGFGDTSWDESICCELSKVECALLHDTATEAAAAVFETIRIVIENDRFDSVGAPFELVRPASLSWEHDDPGMLMTIDLQLPSSGSPRVIACGSASGSPLVEIAYEQGEWISQSFPGAGQWNGFNEDLVAWWRHWGFPSRPVHFLESGDRYGDGRIGYLSNLARETGVHVRWLGRGDIRRSECGELLVDADGRIIERIVRDTRTAAEKAVRSLLESASCLAIEPAWKRLIDMPGFFELLESVAPALRFDRCDSELIARVVVVGGKPSAVGLVRQDRRVIPHLVT